MAQVAPFPETADNLHTIAALMWKIVLFLDALACLARSVTTALFDSAFPPFAALRVLNRVRREGTYKAQKPWIVSEEKRLESQK